METNSGHYSDSNEDLYNNNPDKGIRRNHTKPGLSWKKNMEVSAWAILSASFALACVFYTIHTTALLISFLSGNGSGILGQTHNWPDLSLLETMMQDAWLLVLFVIQHTIMARDFFKQLVFRLIPMHFYRSIYMLSTGIAIQLLASSWVTSLSEPSAILWDYSSSYSACLACQLLHLFGWMYTFAVVFMLDFPEFLGLKQVYYHANNFECPMHVKSPGAQRFYGHFRHASATGLLMIFWVVPCMTLDRLLLALVLTVYLFSTSVDQQDAIYVHAMYERKMKTLHHE